MFAENAAAIVAGCDGGGSVVDHHTRTLCAKIRGRETAMPRNAPAASKLQLSGRGPEKSLKKSFFSSSSQLGTFQSLKSQIPDPIPGVNSTQYVTGPPKKQTAGLPAAANTSVHSTPEKEKHEEATKAEHADSKASVL